MKKSKFALTTLLGAMFINVMNAQTNVNSKLSASSSDITGTIATITSWVTGLFGLLALVQLIVIFVSSQGSGEDKIKKAGTWIFMLIFCAIGFALSKTMFN